MEIGALTWIVLFYLAALFALRFYAKWKEPTWSGTTTRQFTSRTTDARITGRTLVGTALARWKAGYLQRYDAGHWATVVEGLALVTAIVVAMTGAAIWDLVTWPLRAGKV